MQLIFIRGSGKARQCEPLHIETADIEAVRQRILELTAQWEAVPVGKALALHVDADGHGP